MAANLCFKFKISKLAFKNYSELKFSSKRLQEYFFKLGNKINKKFQKEFSFKSKYLMFNTWYNFKSGSVTNF